MIYAKHKYHWLRSLQVGRDVLDPLDVVLVGAAGFESVAEASAVDVPVGVGDALHEESLAVLVSIPLTV